MYLAYNAPHTPFQASEEDIEVYSHIKNEKRRVYAAMVSNMYRDIGRLVERLTDLNINKNTLIVFFSDNGGPTIHGAINGVLKGVKSQVWEGGIRVPFILNWPNGLQANQKIDWPVISLDLLPTIAVQADAKLNGEPLDGKNLFPWLTGKGEGVPHKVLFWENDDLRAIRKGNLMMVKLKAEMSWFLSDLKNDIGENINLAGKKPGEAIKINNHFNLWYNSLVLVKWLDSGLVS